MSSSMFPHDFGQMKQDARIAVKAQRTVCPRSCGRIIRQGGLDLPAIRKRRLSFVRLRRIVDDDNTTASATKAMFGRNDIAAPRLQQLMRRRDNPIDAMRIARELPGYL